MDTSLLYSLLMMVLGMVLIYLAIKHKMEPTLLLPMGFGAILANIPGTMVIGETGILTWLYEFGIVRYEVFPLLLFIGIGAMIDFGPLLEKPWLIFVGAAGQGGVFLTLIVASLFFPINDAASIAIIGAADGFEWINAEGTPGYFFWRNEYIVVTSLRSESPSSSILG